MKLSIQNTLLVFQNLQKGFVCYIHKKKDAYILLPDVDFDTHYAHTGEDIRQTKAYKKIQQKREKYIKVKFKYIRLKKYDLMEEFIENIESTTTQQVFLGILNKKKATQNFEHYLNLYAFLQDWHNFKIQKHQQALNNYLAQKTKN